MEKFLVGPPSKSRKRVNVDVVDFVDNNNEPPDPKNLKTPSHHEAHGSIVDGKNTETQSESYIFNGTFFKIIHSEKQSIKAQCIWNLTSRSTVASDLTYELCNCKFPVPIMTRWNSYYDATNKILQQKDKLSELFSKLKLPKLKSAEWIFIEEYCRVTEPLACALDKLQGEIECFLGFVAPTLFVLRIRLMALSSLVYCTALKLAIMAGIEQRFQHLFHMENHPTDSKAFVLSAMSHPKFKTKWIPERLVNYCKEMFIAEFILLISNTTNKDSESDTDDSDDFFYKSLAHNNNENTIRKLDNSEVEMYFNCKKKELTMLESFSTVKKMFLKYNTTLPSSAPVERLFNSGA